MATERARRHATQRWRAIAVAPAAVACHVAISSEITRPIASRRIAHPEAAIAERAAVVLTEAGQLRFVEPLACPTEDVVRQRATVEVAVRPNLASFTVGVITTAAAGMLVTGGLYARRPAASPYTYAGLASAGVGLPLAIGPWIGNRVELADGGETTVRRPGPRQPCGARPIAARAATVAAGGIEIHGAIDADGVFAISPYQWIDAYRIAGAPPAEITARLDGAPGSHTIAAVLDPAQLAGRAPGFLARAGLDAAIEPLRRVPGIAADAPQLSLIRGDAGPAVRVVLALRNAGPGDAWAVRGQIAAPAIPAIDGRIVYVGKLARGAAVASELVIPVAEPAAAALRGRSIELSIELRDAHGTAPATPVAFRGVLAGAPP